MSPVSQTELSEPKRGSLLDLLSVICSESASPETLRACNGGPSSSPTHHVSKQKPACCLKNSQSYGRNIQSAKQCWCEQILKLPPKSKLFRFWLELIFHISSLAQWEKVQILTCIFLFFLKEMNVGRPNSDATSDLPRSLKKTKENAPLPWRHTSSVTKKWESKEFDVRVVNNSTVVSPQKWHPRGWGRGVCACACVLVTLLGKRKLLLQ